MNFRICLQSGYKPLPQLLNPLTGLVGQYKSLPANCPMNLSGIAKLFLKCQFELQNCIIDTSELADRREQGSIKVQRVPVFLQMYKIRS
jgi:hypothetical protein